MFRTFAAAFLITGLVACNKVPTVQAQSSDSYPSYDNLASAPDDAAQTSYMDDDYAQPDSEAIETTEAPPPLPDYDQPPAPGPDYYWTPGYWAWGPDGYYWVPGDWVEAPWIGAVWTPPYWAFDNGYYLFHAGYWGPHIGFYGGINYGFGYPGRGYYGGYWNNGHLFYNRAVNNVNTNVIRNVYRRDVPRFQSSRTSFNGGHGGLNFRPTQQERVVTHERRAPAQAVQMRIAQQARQQHNRTNFVARPAPQIAPQPTPQEPHARPEERPAPQRHEFHPAPHPAPVTPQEQRNRRPDLRNHLELQQQQRPAMAPRMNAPQQQAPMQQQAPIQRQAPMQRQAPQRRPDLQNHLELQQPRPTPPPAPHMNQAPQQRPAPPAAVPPTPAPQAGQPSAPHGNRGGGDGNGGERGRRDH